MKIKEIGIAYDDYTTAIEHECWHIMHSKYWHKMYDSDWFTGSVFTGIL